MTLRPSKIELPPRRQLDFWKKKRSLRSEGGLESVLGLSWVYFGRSWGSLGGLLVSSGVLLGVSWGFLGSQGTILGSSWVLLGASWVSPALFWGGLGGLLGAFRESCWPLKLSWDCFWCSCEPPGGYLDALLSYPSIIIIISYDCLIFSPFSCLSNRPGGMREAIE